MKIILENFKCWDKKELDLGDGGITLISGKSGIGKSSILDAIFFCLFGKGQKIVSIGKTSCKVTLDLKINGKDFKIVRTRRPNRVVLNDTHEDESAQKIIDREFSSFYNNIGYLKQNSLNSFVLLSPLDKLAFIENFAFKDISENIQESKKNVKNLISERNEDLIKIQTEFNLVTEMLKEKEEPEEVFYPCKTTNKDKFEKKTTVLLSNATKKIAHLREKLDFTRQKLSDTRVYDTTLEFKKKELEKLENDYKNATQSLADLGEIDNNELIRNLEQNLLNLQNHKELLHLEDKYEELTKSRIKKFEREKQRIDNELETIASELWTEYSFIDAKDALHTNKDYLTDMREYNKFQEELQTINFERDILQNLNLKLEKTEETIKTSEDLFRKLEIQSKVLSCPSCETNLRFNKDNTLIIYDDQILEETIETVENNIINLEKKRKKYKKEIKIQEKIQEKFNFFVDKIAYIEGKYEEIISTEDIIEDIEYIEKYISDNNLRVKELKLLEIEKENGYLNLEIIELDGYIETVESDIFKKKSGIQEDNITLENFDENRDKLRDQLNFEKKKSDEYDKVSSKISSLEGLMEENRDEMEKGKGIFSQKYKKCLSEIELEQILTDIYKDLDKNIENEKKQEEILEDIQKFKDYILKRDEYITLEKRYIDCEKKEKIARNKLAASNILKEKISEAEAIAISHVIDSINLHAQVYLESFFIDNPINITTTSFKEDKKGNKKPQINFQIEYKGIEADLEMLSGGELQRVILAFNLALSEMFNIPLVLLDECTSNLEQELTTAVVDGINSNYKGNFVILIAHQVVSGIFNNEIKL